MIIVVFIQKHVVEVSIYFQTYEGGISYSFRIIKLQKRYS